MLQTEIIYRIEYERKDCKDFRSTIDMKLSTKENIIKEFGSIENYLNKMISGGVRITDNYLLKTEDII